MQRSFAHLSAGERVAGYRIEGLIGRGGSASVYRAVPADQPSGAGEPVALKLMHAEDPSGVGRQRFEREAALLGELSHPHVVRILGHGVSEAGQPFIVMPLLEGESVKRLIQREGRLPLFRAGCISLQALSALIAAHGRGIVHRDIKPDNLFLVQSDGEEHLQILDFGLAKALEGHALLTAKLTGVGHRVGTPRYMSPEMARGIESGEASDLYALALVIGEMLSGEPLARSTSPSELLEAHASEKTIELPGAVLASPLGPLMQRALAKSPAVRYRTALQMRADLEAALTGPRRAAPADLAPTRLALPALSVAEAAALTRPARRFGGVPVQSLLALAMLFALLLSASAAAGYWLAG